MERVLLVLMLIITALTVLYASYDSERITKLEVRVDQIEKMIFMRGEQ